MTSSRPMRSSPGVRLVRWQSHRSGALRGYADLVVPINGAGDGFMIHGCPAFRYADGRKSVGLPTRPRLENGRQRLDLAGEPMFDPVVECTSGNVFKRFSTAAVAVIEQRDPHAFDGESGQ
jgi:hypothetical protein